MANLSALALMRPKLGLALGLALALTGCVGLPHRSWSTGPAQPSVSKVVMVWQNNVSLSPDPVNGGRTQPVLAGRMYLFGPKMDHPLMAEGGFRVELFDETLGTTNAPALESWTFRPEDMPNLMKKDLFGVGYTVLLPWGTYRPDIQKLRMRTGYQGSSGLPVYNESIVTLDLGNGVITDPSGIVLPTGAKR